MIRSTRSCEACGRKIGRRLTRPRDESEDGLLCCPDCVEGDGVRLECRVATGHAECVCEPAACLARVRGE